MKYRYSAARQRLYVSDTDLNLISLYSVLRVWRLSGKLDAIVFTTNAATWIFRGPHLRRLVASSALLIGTRPITATVPHGNRRGMR